YAVGVEHGDRSAYGANAEPPGDEHHFFGVQHPGPHSHGEPLQRVEDLAAYFVAQIRAFQASGPYVIAGYCAGGTLAFETARQLLRDGAALSALALFGTPFPTWYRLLPQLCERFKTTVARSVRNTRALASLPLADWRRFLSERLRNLRAERAVGHAAAPDAVLVWRARVEQATFVAIRRYLPGPFSGRLHLFWPSRHSRCADGALAQWP